MILVTGATGFIGSYLVPRLASFSKVRCLVRPGSVQKIKDNASVEVIVEDLASPKNLVAALQGVRCVIHLAALLREKDPQEIQKVNVEGTRHLVEAAKKQSVDHFILVSTENALREDLHDAYASTKREAEDIVRNFSNHLILRPCFVYGRGDNHGLGRLFNAAEKSCLAPLFGGLTCKIQPIYIDDMVEYLLRAVQKNIHGEFIIAGSETVTINDFIKKALEVRGLRKLVIPIPYFVYAVAAKLGDRFFKSACWGNAQLQNIYHGRTYSIEKTVKAFGYAPRGLNAGLKTWLG